MAFAFVDAELTAPLPDVQLRPDQDGVAVLLRARGRPVHYSLHHLASGRRLTGAELWKLTGRDAGTALLAQAIRDELVPPPAAPPVDVTIAICTHGRPALVTSLLGSLAPIRAAHPDVRVLVVDNAPPDDATRDVVGRHAGVDYTTEPRPGLDFGRNRALEEATTEWVAFLDDDVTVDAGWYDGLAEVVAENPDAGAVTGLVLPKELESPAQVAFELRGGFRRGLKKTRWDGQWMPDMPLYPTGAGSFGAGANMVVRRPLALALGGFDDALDTGPPLPGGGDLDIFYRVVRSGAPLCYEPTMAVFHLHRPEMDALRRQYRSWGEGLMAFWAKTYADDPDRRLHLRGLLAWWLVYYGRRTLGGVRHRDLERLPLDAVELWGGLVGLTGSYRRSRRRTERIKEQHAHA